MGLLTEAMQRLLQRIKDKLESLEPERKNLLAGGQKRDLVSWWLGHIRTRISACLVECGYVENVTTEDYINDMPLNFAGVQSNMRLLRQLLDDVTQQRPGSPLLKVIEQLKGEGYAKIDVYIEDCLAVLADELEETKVTIETCEKLLMARKAVFSEQHLRDLMQLLDDLAYLSQMKRLEQAAIGAREKSLHVVPVSGLALGRVVRLEQEMRTVCDVWGPRISRGRASSLSQESSKSRTHRRSSLSTTLICRPFGRSTRACASW